MLNSRQPFKNNLSPTKERDDISRNTGNLRRGTNKQISMKNTLIESTTKSPVVNYGSYHNEKVIEKIAVQPAGSNFE